MTVIWFLVVGIVVLGYVGWLLWVQHQDPAKADRLLRAAAMGMGAEGFLPLLVDAGLDMPVDHELAETKTQLAAAREALRRTTSEREVYLESRLRLSVIAYCEVCWTSSFMPTEKEEDCDLAHPHLGNIGPGHAQCAFCAMYADWVKAHPEA